MDLQFSRVGLTVEPSVGATMEARACTEEREWQTGREKLGDEKQHSNLVLGPSPAQKKKKNISDGKYLLFSVQELISERKGVATRWVFAGDGLFFHILVVVLSFLQAWLLSLWDCNLSHVSVHSPVSHSCGRLLGKLHWATEYYGQVHRKIVNSKPWQL